MMAEKNPEIGKELPVIWEPNPGAQAIFLSREEDEGLYGGAKGGGKSDALFMEALRQKDNPHYKGLLLRRTYPVLSELLERAKNVYPSAGGRWVASESWFVFPSGAKIKFGHCQHEEDKRNYQGHEYQFIGFDQLEEFSESQYLFLMAQNRTSHTDLKCYIRATANPGGPGHWWVKRRFIDGKKPGVTYENRYELPDGRVMTRTSVYVPATVRDNPRVNAGYIATLMELPEQDRKALMDGDWEAYSSGSIFDAHGMRMQQARVAAPQWVGWLKDMGEYIQLVQDPSANLNIFLEPKEGGKYLIGADVAEGVVGGDYSSAHVVDRRTWEVVATWHGHMDPTKYAEALARMGAFYNQAEIVPEINNTMGGTVMARLKSLRYSPIYERERGKWGWETTARTRGDMLGTLMDSVLNGTVKVRDQETLDEMHNFVRNQESGKLEAREGCHDDRVMSLAMALHACRVNPFRDTRRDEAESDIKVTSLVSFPKRGGK